MLSRKLAWWCGRHTQWSTPPICHPSTVPLRVTPRLSGAAYGGSDSMPLLWWVFTRQWLLSFLSYVALSLWLLVLRKARCHVLRALEKPVQQKTEASAQVGEWNGNPLQYYCVENPMDRGAWWATVHRVAKSQTRLSEEHEHWPKCWDLQPCCEEMQVDPQPATQGTWLQSQLTAWLKHPDRHWASTTQLRQIHGFLTLWNAMI